MDSGCDNTHSKRRVRPAQRLYVPPAQRNKKEKDKSKEDNPIEVVTIEDPIIQQEQYLTNCENQIDLKMDVASNLDTQLINTLIDLTEDIKLNDPLIEKDETKCVVVEECENSTKNDDLVIMLENNKTRRRSKNETEMDKEKEEMQRAIVNINRKSRPLIKHVANTNNDILQIPANKTINKKSPVKLVQVANWEDLILEDEQHHEENYSNQLGGYCDDSQDHESYSSDEMTINPKMQELEHVIELYDFPSNFKTQDIMTLYSDINKESMYLKWCDETHALLVLGSSTQAQRALSLQHDIIKARCMSMASSVALQVAAKSDLKPAMKRPQTSMHAARRMITTALGAKSSISREVQQKEREALRIAKELKRAQRQNERDAWEGNPRPSTA